jgi:hypothetical protein
LLGVAGQARLGALIWVYAVTIGLPFLAAAAIVVIVPSWIGVWRLTLERSLRFLVPVFVGVLSLLGGLFFVGSVFWS